jgi:DMSO reductase anchor subunit
VCPYDAPKYNIESGIVEKCTFCLSRIEEDKEPACVNMCPTGALGFDYFDDLATGNNIYGFNDYGIGPAIGIKPSRNEKGPQTHLKEEVPVVSPKKDQPKITFLHEWPLIVFTLLVPILTGLFAGMFGGQVMFPGWAFLSLTFMALLISSFHLGRKERAWMAILHIRDSWLSIEILLFSIFVLLAFSFLVFIDSSWLGVLLIIMGLMTSFSIDRVYDRLRRRKKFPLHSSDTLITATLFIFVFIDYPLGVLLILAVKAIAFFIDRWKLLSFISLARIFFGFFIPVLLFSVSGLQTSPYIITSLILGEMIDRIRFYASLDIKSPGREISDFLGALSGKK